MPPDTHARPRHRRTLSQKVLLGIAASLAAASAAQAASATWSGAADSAWSNTANWSVSPVPGAGDTATFNSASGNTTVDLGAGVTVGAVVFDTASAAAYTIGSGGPGSQTLTFGTAGNAITINPTVAASQLFNANLALSVTGTYTFTNNSTANNLTIAGGISASTTGTKTLTVSGTGNTTINGTMADGSGQVALIKSGTGTLTLPTASTNTGLINVQGGTLVLSNTIGTNATNGNFRVGTVANTPATLKITSGANITNRFNLFLGDAGAGTGGGAVYQSGGTLTLTQVASTDNLRIGSNASGYGYYKLSGGALTTNEAGIGATLANTVGVMEVSGGSFTSNGWIVLGRGTGTSSGLLNVTGGSVEFSKVNGAADANNSRLGLQWGNAAGAQSVVNIANGSVTGDDYVDIAVVNTTGALGAINLLAGGLLQGSRVTAAAANPTALLNFNGGTLKANSTNAGVNFLASGNIDAVTIYSGGGTIDNNGTNITVSRVLAAATGTGVTSIAVTNGGSGYIGAPLVAITGGTGNPATAYAVMVDDGTGKGTYAVGSIVITNPGTYSVAPTTVTFSGGGAVTAATAGSITTGANSSTGGMTFSGSGTTSVTGVNTYTGNTTISAGSTLALVDNASLKFVIGANGVNNKVTGSGNINIDGDFIFDLTGASTTLGHSWQIIDVSTLNETFGATFSIPNFTLNNAKWVRPVNGAFYEFDPATGLLRVVNDPDFVYPAPTVGSVSQGTAYVTGTDIVLNVSASGFGSLTYQWYLDTGSGPQAISGATSSTLTVSNATTANAGIYSVIVTDHAAEASGKPATTTTATFSPITVQPASELAVSYYRFEDGTNGASISPALDSVGGSNLSLLGTATYTNATPLYTVIPATGAANALGANFPATGNNGLVAPTSGTLADTAFTNFTIEALVRFSDLSGVQTIVGRDDVLVAGNGSAGQGLGGQGLLYLSKGGDNKFRVELITKGNTNVQINSASTATIGTWYHVAVVGNAGAGTLKLYVNGTEVGSVTGFNGLFVPTAGSDTPWTVGRGDFNLADTDFVRGDVDEVRIARAALRPADFLNSSGGVAVVPPTASISPNYTSVYPGANVVFTATASSNMGGTLSYQWYKDGVLLSGETAATLSRSSVTLGSDGVYSVVVTDSASAAISTTVTARLRVLDVPAAGARAIGLNFVGAATGTNNWSKELGIMSASQSAGIYPMTNWNNSASVTQVSVQSTPLALTESNASTAAAVKATWNSTGAWSAQSGTGLVANKTPDGLLLHGYIESRLAAGSTVTVSNIPYASYDVYVHVAGGSNGEVGSLKIDRAGSPTYYYRVFQYDSYVVTPTPDATHPYTIPLVLGESLTRSDALVAPPATFVRFTGVTGTDLTVTAADQTLNKNAGGIAAIEIVDRTPAGTAYPVVVTSAPVSKIVQGGANVSFSVTAASQNSGTLAYQWQKDGSNLSGQTGTTLNLSNVTGASSGNYGVVITDTSGLGVATTTRTASLVVVDGTRSLLINGDINTAASPTYVGDGILRADGSASATNLEAVATVWNGILGAAGSATRNLTLESTGLSLSGVTFSYSGADGAEDNTNGGIVGTVAEEFERDYLYANATNTAGITATVGGLQALAGKQVTLYVYAIGKTTKTTTTTNAAVNDTANVTLATANNYTAASAGKTSVYGVGFSDDAGRNIEYNNPIYDGGLASSYVAYTGVVAANGTVSWTVTPDTSAGGGGLAPLVGFQLLVTGADIAPPMPAGLTATAGNGQVSLSWATSSGATSYTIKRATSASGSYTTLSQGVVTGTSYTDTSATNGTTYYYTVAAANSLAQSADSGPVAATPVSLSALQAWRQSKFGTTSNTGNAADTADPDGDGQVNLLEYALGTEPNSANALTVTVDRSGNFLTLSFNHIGDTTLTYTVQASNDLGTWSTAQTYTGFTSTGSTTYTDTVPLTQSRRFLRLVVTAP